MTEERDGDRWWNELPEDERQRYLKAFMAMMSISASRFRDDQRRLLKEPELTELRLVSKAADPMLAGIPETHGGRAHPCC